MYRADRQPKHVIYRAVPHRVALGEEVVDGDQVRALALQRVQIEGQAGDEGFTLTGLHFGYSPLVQHHSTDHLHIEMPQAEGSDRGLTHDRERLHLQIVDLHSLIEPHPKLIGLGAKLVVGQSLDLGKPRAFILSATLRNCLISRSLELKS